MSFSAAVACAWLATWWPAAWLASAALGVAAAIFGVRALNAPIEIQANRHPDLRVVGRRAITPAVIEARGESRGESRNELVKPAIEPAAMAPPLRYPLLRPEEEEEIEAMFQRLKSAGSMDVRGESETS
ncbi:MAG TPA: hypothetical protein VKS01_12545 [Bryobacteraceae bacterium]|nr:hypothetical protein [Bryobacteraceae bacterium]